MNLRELEKAWSLRLKLEISARSEAYRVFHGPGEGTGELRRYAIDRFGAHAWITEWEERSAASPGPAGSPTANDRALEAMSRFLEAQGILSAVVLERPKGSVPEESKVLFGAPPESPFPVREHDARFLIRLRGTRHPGLFLDHEPLRRWLASNAEGWKVLNCFAYTGSLSVAAAIGGAEHVTTLDLSKPTITWARDNWALNGFESGAADFISGDVFEKLPRLSRHPAQFDCVILDPPSFSRGKKGNFSTSKDLYRLHRLTFGVLKSGGVLATSINSANVPRAKYREEVTRAASDAGFALEVIQEISLPQSFPVREPKQDYLKGWIFRLRSARNPRAAVPRKKASRG